MGMIAVYQMIDDETLAHFKTLDNNTLCDTLEELEVSVKFKYITLDKIWDAVHCFLTGVSASNPIEGNKLSEAVVGVNNFNLQDEGADFITWTEHKDLV